MSGAEIAVVAILGLFSLYFIIKNGIILIKQLKKLNVHLFSHLPEVCLVL